MKQLFAIGIAAVVAGAAVSGLRAEESGKGWVSLFDGKSFHGWKINENESSWKIQDGAIVARGERSHLFFVGDEQPFKNFELKVDVQTEPGSNGGIYFHTKYQPEGWPKYGYEAQVNNSGGDPRKTGSLYAVQDVLQAPAADGKWFTEHIIVQGSRIRIKVDGKTVVDFTEAPDRKPGEDFTRKLDQGTFAFQAHDPNSTVRYKNVRVRRLD